MNMLTRGILTRHDTEMIDTIDIDTPCHVRICWEDLFLKNIKIYARPLPRVDAIFLFAIEQPEP